MIEARILSARALVRVLAGAEPLLRQQTALDLALDSLRTASRPAEIDRLDALIWRLWRNGGTQVAVRLLNKALHHVAGDRLGAAIEALDGAVKADFAFAEAWNRRAIIHYMLGDNESAIMDIERVLILEPRHYGALAGLGQLMARVGEPAGALEAFEAALAINPHLDSVHEAVDELRAAMPRLPAGRSVPR